MREELLGEKSHFRPMLSYAGTQVISCKDSGSHYKEEKVSIGLQLLDLAMCNFWNLTMV